MEDLRLYPRCRVVKGGLRVHLVPKVAHSSIGNTIGEHVLEVTTPDEPSDDYRFMVVRHPLDRLVSSWAFFNYNAPTHDLTKYIAGKVGTQIPMSFNDWFRGVLDNYDYNPHFDKQTMFTGGQEIDCLVKLENLEKEWPAISRRFKLPAMIFSNSSKHEHWSEYYTDAMRQEAEEVFAEDVILYNKAR